METSEIGYRVADFLKRHAPFQVADEQDLVGLAARGRVRFHERHEYILWQGEPHKLHLFVIQQGTVSLWDDEGGASELRDVRGAGDMLGIERYTGARACLYTARAETDVVLYGFPADDFEACVLKHPRALQYVTAESRAAADFQQPGSGPRDAAGTFLLDVAGRKPLETCRSQDRLTDVAARLLSSRSGALALLDQDGRATGVVSVRTMLAWIAAGGGDAGATIDSLASLKPPPALPPDSRVSDGVLTMGADGAEALAITLDGTAGGRVQTLVTARDLAPFFGEQPNALLEGISKASGPDDLRDINGRARAFALAHLAGASSADWLARFTHLVDRAIVSRLVMLTDRDAPGCWCLTGAAGRAEILTRQAPQLVVLLDRDDRQDRARQTYARVLEALAECDFLPGPPSAVDADAVVAPVSEWRERYRQWIQDPVRQQMYRARSLFDLRPVAGPRTLWEAIETEVSSTVSLDFVRVLANDCLATLPPLTFFKDAVVEQDGEQVSTFRLEHVALQPLVDVGRVFGIATGACLGRSTLDGSRPPARGCRSTKRSSARRGIRCAFCSGSRAGPASARARRARSFRRRS